MAGTAFALIQLFGVALAGGIFYYAERLYEKGNFSRKDLWMWCGFSAILFIASVIPTFFEQLTSLFTKRSLDALLIFGLLVSFGLIFQIYIRLQQTNRELTELVRKVAIELEKYKKQKGR